VASLAPSVHAPPPPPSLCIWKSWPGANPLNKVITAQSENSYNAGILHVLKYPSSAAEFKALRAPSSTAGWFWAQSSVVGSRPPSREETESHGRRKRFRNQVEDGKSAHTTSLPCKVGFPLFPWWVTASGRMGGEIQDAGTGQAATLW